MKLSFIFQISLMQLATLGAATAGVEAQGDLVKRCQTHTESHPNGTQTISVHCTAADVATTNENNGESSGNIVNNYNNGPSNTTTASSTTIISNTCSDCCEAEKTPTPNIINNKNNSIGGGRNINNNNNHHSSSTTGSAASYGRTITVLSTTLVTKTCSKGCEETPVPKVLNNNNNNNSSGGSRIVDNKNAHHSPSTTDSTASHGNIKTVLSTTLVTETCSSGCYQTPAARVIR